MIVPIRCFTCAKVIADKYDYYMEELSKLEKQKEMENKKKDPDYKYFTSIHTKEILDNLGLTRYCCRRMLLSTSDMMDII
jgi:DNA-directed RNA polymerase subunit N (RpoN/RPB10)